MTLALKTDFSNINCIYNMKLDISEFPSSLRAAVQMQREYATMIERKKEGVIGKGAQGVVYKGWMRGPDCRIVDVAIKVFERHGLFERELTMIWKAQGVPHVVAFYCEADLGTSKNDCLVFGFIAAPTLTAIRQMPNRPEETVEEIRELAKQFFTCLSGLQKTAPNRPKGIIHRDLSGTNVCWDGRELTVIDFGSACEIGSQSTIFISKPYMTPPEIYLEHTSTSNKQENETPKYTEVIDMWSAALLIHEFVVRSPLIPNWVTGKVCGSQEVFQMTCLIGMPPKSYLKRAAGTAKFFTQVDGDYLLKPELREQKSFGTLEELHQKCRRSSPQLVALLKKILVWENRLTPDAALADPFFQS